ncbi:MAG: hypothetical protein ACYCXG_11760 [Acidiferrobacter sp.]
MANNLFVSNAYALPGGKTIVLVEYKVQTPQKAYINQLSVDLNPASDFPYINFSLYIDEQLVPEMANINSQITQSYFPLALETSIIVDPGRTIKWVVGSTNVDTATDDVYASFGGILRG